MRHIVYRKVKNLIKLSRKSNCRQMYLIYHYYLKAIVKDYHLLQKIYNHFLFSSKTKEHFMSETDNAVVQLIFLLFLRHQKYKIS